MQECLWYICSPVWVSPTQRLYSEAHGNLLYKDLCHTLSPPRLLLPDPLSLWEATADPCLWRRPSNSYMPVWLSLFWGTLLPSLGPGAHKVLFVPSKHLLRVSALILNMTTLLLPSCCSFSFALGLWVPFSGMFQHSSVDGCSEASVILVFLQEEISAHPSTLPSWTVASQSLLAMEFSRQEYWSG